MNQVIQTLISDPDRTNALAAFANVVLAGLALVVAVASILLSLAALRRQTLHNKLSVRPIPFIACADYLGRLRVKIYNNGTGPFLIEKISVARGGVTKEDVISWMPTLPPRIYWSNFTSGSIGRSVPPGDGLNLIELVGDHSDADFSEFRNRCRAALKDLTVTLEYTDIYGDKFDPCVRKLEWFGR